MSAPTCLAYVESSMASRVEFAPVPAIIGIRPAAWSIAVRISKQCSSKSTVGDSPVVPTTTMPSEPSRIWKSTRARRPCRSKLPSSNIGVTMATRLPFSMANFPNKKARILTDSFRRGHVASRRVITGTNALNFGRFRRRDFHILISDYTQARFGDFEQFTRSQQEIRIRWLAEAFVARGERLIDQHASCCKRADDVRKQGTVQVVRDDHAIET